MRVLLLLTLLALSWSCCNAQSFNFNSFACQFFGDCDESDDPVVIEPVVPVRPGPRPCCLAFTSLCLACAEGVTEAEYCRRNPETVGCKPPPAPICRCIGDSLECKACTNGVTEEQYCADYPDTDGCPQVSAHLILLFPVRLY